MNYYLKTIAAIISFTSSLLIFYQVNKGYAFELIAEIPNAATQEIKIYFNGNKSLYQTMPLKPYAFKNADFSYIFNHIPSRIQLIEIIPTKLIGVDVKLHNLSIMAPETIPGVKRSLISNFDLANITFIYRFF